MPAKGQKLTPEHKAKLEEARKEAVVETAEKKAEHVDATAEFVDEVEQAKATSQAKALEEAEAQRRAMVENAEGGAARTPPAPITPPSYEPTGKGSAQSTQEWGPYSDYVLAATPYGTFAVEPGYVMFFEQYQYFNDREKRMAIGHRPIYIWYGSGPEDKDYGKNRDQLVRGLPEGMQSAPPGYVESQAPVHV